MAGVLHRDGALGGPVTLSLQSFFIGVNDPFGEKSDRPTVHVQHFRYRHRPWLSAHGQKMRTMSSGALSIARGEEGVRIRRTSTLRA